MGLKEGWLPGQLSFSTLASLAHRRSWSEAKCRASRQVGGGDAASPGKRHMAPPPGGNVQTSGI